MTITRIPSRIRPRYTLWLVVVGLVPLGVAGAWQSSVPATSRVLVVAPAPSTAFQQTVQQQQLRSQLQTSQLEQQLHQSVSDNARLPNQKSAAMQRQQDHADQAQADRDRAAQQAEVNRYQNQAALPQAIPANQPAVTHGGG